MKMFKFLIITLLISTSLFAVVRYDSKGNLIEDAIGNLYTYDANNNRLSITYTNGRTDTWTYDGNNVCRSYTDYLGYRTLY
jgi:hypothetical protein